MHYPRKPTPASRLRAQRRTLRRIRSLETLLTSHPQHTKTYSTIYSRIQLLKLNLRRQ